VGVSRAFQLANIPVEGQEIVGQQLVERVEFRVKFRVQGGEFGIEFRVDLADLGVERVNAAVEPPPHGPEGGEDGKERCNFCPVHVSSHTRLALYSPCPAQPAFPLVNQRSGDSGPAYRICCLRSAFI